MKSAIMSVSSKTGNTRRVADAVRAGLEYGGFTVSEFDAAAPDGSEARHGGEAPDGREAPDGADAVIICFWCYRSTVDPQTAEALKQMHGRKVVAFGTMGGYPTGEYADKVRANVEQAIDAGNECLGVFLCQGRVPMDNIETRKNLPVDNPHHLDEAGIARLMESQKHPDQHDLDAAAAFALSVLAC